MDACEIQQAGGGFVSKLNKGAKKINVEATDGVLGHTIYDDDGNVKLRREFKLGEHARVVRGVPPLEEIDEDKIEDIEELPHGEILAFWTVVDGDNAYAHGAEIQRDGFKYRLPIRILLPMANPRRPSAQTTEG